MSIILGLRWLKQMAVYIIVMICLYLPDIVTTDPNIDQLLENGTKLLATGKLADALSLYSKAIDMDPKNYLAFYRRATAYLAMGKSKLALPDLEKTIELNGGYAPAVKQRASVNLKLGKFTDALADYYLLKNTDSESESKIHLVESLKLKKEAASNYFQTGQYSEAIQLLNELIEIVSLGDDLREIRGTCFINTGEIQRGIQDLRHGVHLTNDNREGLLRVSILMYRIGLAVQALEEIRECLRLDQSDKACHDHYKKVKKLAKAISAAQEASEAKQYETCINEAKKIAKLEPDNTEYIQQSKNLLCHCQAKSGSVAAVEVCEQTAKHYSSSSEHQCDLAEAYINADRLNDAIKVYQKVLEHESRNQRARKGIERAQRLLKTTNQRDYYKILGVSRGATKKDILKAYRKLAAEWHPDKFSRDEKAKAEKKFIDITAAKEVLTNPEKRQQFDQGVDPLNPENQGQQRHPFGPGGFPFQNFNPFEGGHFEFHFG